MQSKAIIRKQFSKLNVDAILVTDLLNVRYLTGFTGSSGCLVLTKNQSLFLTDFRYQEQARLEVKGCKIKIENSERSVEIKEICNDLGIRKLGFEDHNVTYGYHKNLLKRNIKLVPLSNVVESLRIVKSAKEIESISTAIKRAESAFRKLLPYIRTGVTEQKLALILEENLKNEGCKKLPFEVIVASGSLSALPHAQPTAKKLKKGDLVVFDWGGEYNGYFSDMTRTVLLNGRDISRQKTLYYTVLAAQQRALNSVCDGIPSSAVDKAARDFIEDEGFGDFFGHGTGHGVGLAVHEKPVVSWRNKEIIRENMIFTIEPGIYLPDFGGVRIEDMVLAGKNKAEVMTSLPKKLKIIQR